jgi:hypothetical protein
MTLVHGTRKFCLFSLVLIFLTAACSPTITPAPEIVPEAITAAYPPSLKLLDEALNFCAHENPSIALHRIELPAGSLIGNNADLLFWLGEPPEKATFSAPLAVEEIALIVNSENPIQAIAVEELRALLRGEIRNWEALNDMDADVAVWTYPEGNEIFLVIEEAFLQDGTITSQGYLAPDPAAIIDAISGDVGAIGFLPKAWLTDDIKSIDLDGEGSGIDLSRPVLALAEGAPEGAARSLLACLQSPQGKEILNRRYEPWAQ